MGVLVSGLIGAVASAAAWLGIEHYAGQELSWLVILIGVVTGFMVHAAAGKTSGAGYLRGAMAALLALAAIVGGQKVKAEIMKAANEAAANQIVQSEDPAKDEDEAAEEKTDDTAEAEPAKTVADMTKVTGAEPTGIAKPNLKNSLSDKSMIWICVSALAAYVIGKGGGDGSAQPQPAQEKSEPQDQDGAG